MKNIIKNWIIGVQFGVIALLSYGMNYQFDEYKGLFYRYATVTYAQNQEQDRDEAEAIEIYQLTQLLKKKNPHVPYFVVEGWAHTIKRASIKHNVNVDLFLRVLHVESRTIHYGKYGIVTTSPVGAKGIAQVMPFWYKDCPHASKPSDLNNGTISIMCGAFVLRHYLDKTKDINIKKNPHVKYGHKELGLTGYNGGMGAVKLYLRGRDVTKQYAKKVLSRI